MASPIVIGTGRRSSVMKRLKASLAVVVVLASGVSAQTQKDNDPVVTIDGTKNPELVPAWAAWQQAFHIMSGPYVHGDLPIPTTVWHVTTPEQRDLIRKEALATVANENQLGSQALKLRDGLTADNMKQRTEEAQGYEMKRRQFVLDVRDRLLAALPPLAQTALREFAEVECKKGYKASMLKSQLEQFRLPE
jgi:hypothetical protein